MVFTELSDPKFAPRRLKINVIHTFLKQKNLTAPATIVVTIPLSTTDLKGEDLELEE